MKICYLLLSLLIANTIDAQIKISGKVTDNRGRMVPLATITLVDTYDGAVADSSGLFSFTTTEKGAFTLEAKALGYKSQVQNITIAKDAIIINFQLKEEVSELTAVMVTAGSFEASDKKRAATVLNSIDVVTTGGANADIVAAVKTLPGAQQIGESEGLFVRGGAGYETKQFIDGTMVNNPFFTSVPDIAQRGRFSPFLFKGTVFSTGGYSALYGQALSSALILETIDLPERSEASASLAPIFTGAGFQQLAKNKKSSWGVNYSYTNLKAYFEIVKQKPDYFKVPAFHSADANFRIKTKNGGMVKYYTTFSANQLGLRRPNIDSTDLKDAFGLNNLNWYNNLSWKENFNNGWKMNLGLSFSINKDEITQTIQNAQNTAVVTGKPWIDNKNFLLDNQQNFSQVKLVLDKKLSGISVFRFGGEYWYSDQKSKYNQFTSVLKDHFNAAFAEADLFLTNNIAAKLGMRLEHSSIINKSNFAPRLSLAHKAGKNAQVSVAYGVFYQKPENTQLIATTNLGYTQATHYIVNYQKTTKDYTLRVEAFQKDYKDLVKTFPTINNDGTGYAKGIELFWRDKKTIKNVDYWISYSYLDTKREFLNYPTQLQPGFAANHTASLVTKKFVTKWKTGFNTTYSFASGRPYYFFQTQNNKVEIKDQGKTKSYHNLGFSLNYLPNLGKQNNKTFIVLVASVTNVLGADPVFNYNYNYNGTRKEPVGLPAKRFYFIGAFFSWGVDRSQDAINNNL